MTFKEFIKGIEAMPFSEVATSGSPQLKELVDRATDLFDEYSLGDQSLALAILFGMLTATLEGEAVTFEVEHQALVGYWERLQLFEAIAGVTYRGAMAERSDPTAPDFVKRRLT